MRNRNEENGLEVTAISGTYGVLLSIRITDASIRERTDFLGFAIKREDLTEDEAYYLKGFKYFPQTAPDREAGQLFDTDKHPVQSCFWEDFTVKHGHDYRYHIEPIFGKPKKLEKGPAAIIAIRTEEVEGAVHAVHFNRGIAGSLAYARKFGNKRPDRMTDSERAAVRGWLSRGLEEALLGFIQKAIDHRAGLRIAFYEFTYQPVLLKLKEAIEAGCDVRIIYDSREQEEENQEAIEACHLPSTALIPRKADPQVPSHNKFMVLLGDGDATEVWTGSTNITDKGILGQSNVGHVIKDANVAGQFLQYWNKLSEDPEKNAFRSSVAQIQDDITSISGFTEDCTVFFSPRSQKQILKTYAEFIDSAQEMVCGIFPFSFNKDMKAALGKATNHLKYIMVDKIGNAEGIIRKDVGTVIVNGAYFEKAMFDWLTEINSGVLLNKRPSAVIGTNYVHNKLLLIDPLSSAPTIIVGSANFSDASVLSNDENTLVIRGGKELRRTCDIYFTEFYRIFHHFFVRKAVAEIHKEADTTTGSTHNPLHLQTDNSWYTSFGAAKAKAMLQEQMQSMPLDY